MKAFLSLLALLPAISAVQICEEFPQGRRSFSTSGEFEHFIFNPLCPLYDSRDPVNPTYTMYTRSNRANGQILTLNSVPGVFNPSRRTIFISHGWNTDSEASSWMGQMKDNLLNRDDVNVVLIDWRGGSRRLNYDLSSASTRTTGAWTAEHMLTLRNAGANYNNIHCIGHSLGAHLCGFAGHWVRDHLGGLLARVSGMDPAGPNFQRNDENTRVNRFAANYVDILHTDTVTLGNRDLLGHQDYYPADGQSQPGCGLDVGGNCSHGRAHTYYVESVENDCYISREICTDRDHNVIPTGCSSGAASTMGYGSTKSVLGNNQRIYRLDVNRNSPHCRG